MKAHSIFAVATATSLAMPFLFSASAANAQSSRGLTEGKPDMKSIGALEAGPDGVLFAADPKGAAVFALDTGDGKEGGKGKLTVKEIDKKLAALLGTTADQIIIADLAVNAESGNGYVSVLRGKGPDAAPALVRVSPGGTLTLVSLDKIPFSKMSLTDAPEDKETGEGRRKMNRRTESITDLAFINGKLAIAGLSNEEFASTLRIMPYPFEKEVMASSVEIFHGAHGKEETHSPIRTFIPMDIAGEPNIIASYTCTPLVRIPISDLKPKTLVKGTTVAELGNRNRPLDMIEYTKDGARYILMANSARGIMKVSTGDIDKVDPIKERVDGTKGLPYETIEAWKGVTQLAKVDDKHAVVIRDADGSQILEQLELP